MMLCCLLFEGPDPKPVLKGDTRTYRVFLDPNQYQKDMTEIVKGNEVRHICQPVKPSICLSFHPILSFSSEKIIRYQTWLGIKYDQQTWLGIEEEKATS